LSELQTLAVVRAWRVNQPLPQPRQAPWAVVVSEQEHPQTAPPQLGAQRFGPRLSEPAAADNHIHARRREHLLQLRAAARDTHHAIRCVRVEMKAKMQLREEIAVQHDAEERFCHSPSQS